MCWIATSSFALFIFSSLTVASLVRLFKRMKIWWFNYNPSFFFHWRQCSGKLTHILIGWLSLDLSITHEASRNNASWALTVNPNPPGITSTTWKQRRLWMQVRAFLNFVSFFTFSDQWHLLIEVAWNWRRVNKIRKKYIIPPARPHGGILRASEKPRLWSREPFL